MCFKVLGQASMLWLAVHYPNWLLQYQSYCHGLPLDCETAIYNKQTSKILAASPRAQMKGITAEQSVATALTLVPSLTLIAFDRRLSQEANTWLCHWSYGYSARVVLPVCQHQIDVENRGVIDAGRVSDTLLLEVGSMLKVFAGLESLIEQYRAQADSYSLRWQLALGNNPLLVSLAAKYQPQFVSGDHSDYHQNRDESAQFSVSFSYVTLAQIAALAVEALPVSDETLRTCHNMGLYQIQHLLALPRAELAKRFEPSLLTLLAQLNDQQPQPQRFFQPPKRYKKKQTLLYDVEHIEGVIFPLSRMLSELANYLQCHQQAILSLKVYFVYRDKACEPLCLTIHYPFAEHRSEGLLKLLRVQLDRSALASPVVSIELVLGEVVPLSLSPKQWWQEGAQDESAKRLLATLQARLGDKAVKGIKAVSASMPESCWQATGLSQWQGDQCRESGSHYHQNRLHKKPIQAKTAAIRDEQQLKMQIAEGLNDGRFRPSWLLKSPQLIQPDDVELLKGPERLSSDWQAGIGTRDYYIAQHNAGGLCWVYRDQQGLFLQGWFS
ncbi:Y-family DNA polymerase [Shewanella psychrotolerans]|uniref:Y-family DNA polymerase n=1 Tax=Shewanella psychrotolerans TaxID=2864206 RepID=UPI001C65BE6F|nr:DNA polymerase Y family protein [Shewanella psychrotolerans]QYJ99954.1 DNA polymerase Y family protein [Shewanella psychrotolerans]